MMDCSLLRADDGQVTCRWCKRPWGLPVPATADLTTYHRYCPNAPSRGLGDTIAKVTRLVGIKPCGGCKKRQAWLNELFPYKP